MNRKRTAPRIPALIAARAADCLPARRMGRYHGFISQDL